jgi:predicted DsbA family dithiol-disulfide isomerase
MEKLRAAYEIEFQFTLFPLHPETPEEGISLEKLFAGRSIDIAASQARLAKLMKEEGLPYNAERSMTYNSRLAQELAKWAETKPNGEAIHNALYEAYFVDGLNLALAESLLQVVRRLRLPEEEAREALLTRTFRDAVDQDWQRSREMGVTAVPTFVIGKRGLVGAQLYEELERLVVESGASRLK